MYITLRSGYAVKISESHEKSKMILTLMQEDVSALFEVQIERGCLTEAKSNYSSLIF
jgi:hypothetical protein